ncbi:MAG: hypothetical protein ACRCXT_08660 [Paraclostridium sp.]
MNRILVLGILENNKVKVALIEGVYKKTYTRKVRYFNEKPFVLINDREYFLK